MPAGIELLSSLLKVAAVFALLVLTLKGLARYQRGRGANPGRATGPSTPLVEVMDQTRLGRSANLATVKVGERILLLGLTEGSIETLADVTDDIDITVDEPADVAIEQTSVLDHAMDLLRSGNFRR